MTSEHAEQPDTIDGITRPAPRRFKLEIPGMIWFYGLWIVVAMISNTLGHSAISREAGLFPGCG